MKGWVCFRRYSCGRVLYPHRESPARRPAAANGRGRAAPPVGPRSGIRFAHRVRAPRRGAPQRPGRAVGGGELDLVRTEIHLHGPLGSRPAPGTDQSATCRRPSCATPAGGGTNPGIQARTDWRRCRALAAPSWISSPSRMIATRSSRSRPPLIVGDEAIDAGAVAPLRSQRRNPGAPGRPMRRTVRPATACAADS